MKTILKVLLILTVYELTKYVTEQVLIRLQANDDIDKYPKDYEVTRAVSKSQSEMIRNQYFNSGGLL